MPLDVATKLLFQRAMTPVDRECIRLMRNEGCRLLAHDARPISSVEHARFWRDHGRDIRAWIACAGDAVIGLASIRRRDGRDWAFTLVSPEHQGRGYGKQLLEHLMVMSGGELWATTRRSNGPAMGIHRATGGWTVTGEADGIVTWVYRQ